MSDRRTILIKVTNLKWLPDKVGWKVKKPKLAFANNLAFKLTNVKSFWAALILKFYLEAFIFD